MNKSFRDHFILKMDSAALWSDGHTTKTMRLKIQGQVLQGAVSDFHLMVYIFFFLKVSQSEKASDPTNQNLPQLSLKKWFFSQEQISPLYDQDFIQFIKHIQETIIML